MKYRFFFLVLMAHMCTMVYAERMMHIMQDYNAVTMSAEEIDKALNNDNDNESMRYVLGYRNEQKVFRHSFFAEYYLVDTQKNDTIPLSDEPVRDAVMSPNGKYVVYAKNDNNLYIYKVDFKTEVAVTGGEQALGLTNDENTPNEIFNGVSDWLYEEEFGITCLFAFSPDSKQLAFVRLNEKDVPTFTWQTFLSDQTTALYPQSHSLRYPKAGEANATASACVYDIHYKTIRTLQMPENMNGYIPRIGWTPLKTENGKGKTENQVSSEVIILHLNRDQTKMDVLKANPKSTLCHPFYKEESKKYFVNYELFDQWQWLSDGRVIVVSEKGGYVQAYLYNAQGMEQRLLTPEKRDITTLYGMDEKNQILFYQAANNPIERQAYALALRKNITTPLTTGEGTHTLTFSKDWKRFVDCYHSTTTPHRYTLYETENGKVKTENGKVLLHNDSILKAWKTLGVNEKEFFTITTERGDELNAWRILPKNFDAKKQYPVVMMQYSGPTSQRVLNNWRKRFAYSLSDAGYLVLCVDGRGTGARGREWRNATYMQLGIKEAEDQISVAQYLQTLPYVDANRIALCGWSYGGYQTLMCMSQQTTKQLWKCGIAIAPVTTWRLYDSAYTERFMRRPQVNEFGYAISDAIALAKDLKGQLLLVHGTADDNVHAQNTYLYIDALVQAGKQFEMQLYIDDNHSMRKPTNYKHLHERIMLFLEKNL